jgi:hypothetical protein
MGPPPRQLRASVNNRMKKGVRIGDTLLFLCVTSDCAAALAPLHSTRSAATEHQGARVVHKQQYLHGHAGTGAQAGQVTLFQYLHAYASQFMGAQPPIDNVFTVAADSPSTRVSAHLDVAGTNVMGLLFQPPPSTPAPLRRAPQTRMVATSTTARGLRFSARPPGGAIRRRPPVDGEEASKDHSV